MICSEEEALSTSYLRAQWQSMALPKLVLAKAEISTPLMIMAEQNLKQKKYCVNGNVMMVMPSQLFAQL